MQKKTIIEADYGEIEDLVKKHYGLGEPDYSFVEAQECHNNTSHRFKVEAEFDVKDWDRAKEMRWSYSNHTLLNRLCFDGHIEPGEYYIRVSW